jgi:predicted small secreted protein
MKRKLVVALLILMLVLTACSNQTRWIVRPGQEVTIYGHTCLSGAGARVILTEDQARSGYTVENAGAVSMTVTACD